MEHLWLIPALPLAGFVVNGVLGRRLPKAVIHSIAVGTVALAFLWVVKTLFSLGAFEEAHVEQYGTWIHSGIVDVSLGFMVDRLTAVMLLVVTGVGLLIHIYSIGYMAHEGGYYRFFAYLNLFMFFMLVLVLADNFLVMFVGWEGVGLCSYLLIGFYFTKKSASTAGNKAFIVNRIGDFGFSLAMFLMLTYVRHGDLLPGFRSRAGRCPPKPPPASSPPSACCCLSAPPASRRRFRCTSGCRTRWKVRRRSPRSSMRPPW